MTGLRASRLTLLLGVAMLTSPPAAAAAPEPVRPLYVFIYSPGPAWKPGLLMSQQNMGPHGAYMTKLDREGRIVAAGGFSDAVGGGMAIIRAAGADDAKQVLAADPAVLSGLFQAKIQAWRPRFGDPARAAAPQP